MISGRVAPDVLAVLPEHAEQVPRTLGVAEEVAAVGVLGDHPQRLALAAAADEDRDVAAQRLRVVVGARDRVVGARDRRLLLGEHRARDPQVVLEALEALLQRRERVAVGVVLGLEPARADPVERTPAGDDVERRRDLGVLGRVAVADAGDEQPERDRRRARREAGEHRVALEHPALRRPDRRDLVVVVHHRDRGEARPLRREDDVDELLEHRVGPHPREVEVREVQVELDRRAHATHATPRRVRQNGSIGRAVNATGPVSHVSSPARPGRVHLDVDRALAHGARDAARPPAPVEVGGERRAVARQEREALDARVAGTLRAVGGEALRAPVHMRGHGRRRGDDDRAGVVAVAVTGPDERAAEPVEPGRRLPQPADRDLVQRARPHPVDDAALAPEQRALARPREEVAPVPAYARRALAEAELAHLAQRAAHALERAALEGDDRVRPCAGVVDEPHAVAAAPPAPEPLHGPVDPADRRRGGRGDERRGAQLPLGEPLVLVEQVGARGGGREQRDCEAEEQDEASHPVVSPRSPRSPRSP